MNKKIFWVVFLLMSIFFSSGMKNAYGANVAVIISDDIKIYSYVLEGIQETLKEPVKVFTLKEKVRTIDTIERIKATSPDLVLVVGDRAAKAVSNKFTETPVVFCSVVYPRKYDLLDKENICGVSIRISVKEEFDFLKRVAPDVKKIGVIYNPKKNRQLIEEAQQFAPQFGLELVAVKARNKIEVSKAIKNFNGVIDAYWMILDHLVVNRVIFRALILFTVNTKSPFMVPAAPFVRGGALISVSSNYKGMGKQAAQIAAQIISGTVTPQEIGLLFPEHMESALNLTTAKRIKLPLIPESILEQIDYIYDDIGENLDFPPKQ